MTHAHFNSGIGGGAAISAKHLTEEEMKGMTSLELLVFARQNMEQASKNLEDLCNYLNGGR